MQGNLIQQFLKLNIPKRREKHSLCHTWDLNLQYSDPESVGRVATPGGDLLDDLLTPFAGTLRTIAFTIYKTGD